MFARALTAPRCIGPLLAALTVLAGCGGEMQDAHEPERAYRVDVVQASFPAKQSIAGGAVMRIKVRNADSETVPDVAVTVATRGAQTGAAPVAFAQKSDDNRLADQTRPVWVMDSGPKGGTTAYTNTWALGSLPGGATKTFEWHVTPITAGTYTIDYSVSPGLNGKATVKSGSHAKGTFNVTVSDKPVPARVNDKGQVVRGQNATAGPG